VEVNEHLNHALKWHLKAAADAECDMCL